MKDNSSNISSSNSSSDNNNNNNINNFHSLYGGISGSNSSSNDNNNNSNSEPRYVKDFKSLLESLNIPSNSSAYNIVTSDTPQTELINDIRSLKNSLSEIEIHFSSYQKHNAQTNFLSSSNLKKSPYINNLINQNIDISKRNRSCNGEIDRLKKTVSIQNSYLEEYKSNYKRVKAEISQIKTIFNIFEKNCIQLSSTNETLKKENKKNITIIRRLSNELSNKKEQILESQKHVHEQQTKIDTIEKEKKDLELTLQKTLDNFSKDEIQFGRTLNEKQDLFFKFEQILQKHKQYYQQPHQHQQQQQQDESHE
ncbi:hypothetical protein CYY_001145 [Polysphondylium violaceum]|uniref:Uncharacterized protein n=1 Tax=Polysphondylium violaceum TaxID=133409 RepID=A0A8J4Q2G0_9MYCE|nr:hypothetical protein CYY_001145 [Polysphondylium violaceum]